jgi:signal transduction histidine kinase
MSRSARAASSTSNVGQWEIGGSFVQMQETERARIARELHDSLGQKIALLQMELDQVSRSLPSSEQTRLHQLSAHVADIARELHDVSHELHPLRLELLGLARSIEALRKESSRQSGVEITFVCDPNLPQQIGASESLCLYRVAQEAIHNVVKHSKATRACVQLACRRGALRLSIADTGQGFDTSVATSGLGLTSMRQRVELLKGTFSVQTHKGGGTRISVRIPLRRQPITNHTVALRPRLVTEAKRSVWAGGHESRANVDPERTTRLTERLRHPRSLTRPVSQRPHASLRMP